MDKWIWFAIASTVLIGAAYTLSGYEMIISAVLSLVALVFFTAAAAEFAAHYSEVRAGLLERRTQAMNTTPLVMIAEKLQGLHPENVRLLERFIANTVWDVEVDLKDGERDWMLRGTDVHFGFIEYVLDHSLNHKLYARNNFSEGSKKWDPAGLVDDREQHRQFEHWLASRLIVVRQYGENNPALFMPPWTPERLKKLMGFEGPQDLYAPEEKMTIKNLTL